MTVEHGEGGSHKVTFAAGEVPDPMLGAEVVGEGGGQRCRVRTFRALVMLLGSALDVVHGEPDVKVPVLLLHVVAQSNLALEHGITEMAGKRQIFVFDLDVLF